jgi:hypothetical protein
LPPASRVSRSAACSVMRLASLVMYSVLLIEVIVEGLLRCLFGGV